MEEKWITICYYSSEPNRGAGMFINYNGKFPNCLIAWLLSYIMPARLFGPALVFGTLS